MAAPAIEFQHVSKRYRGARGYRSLRDDLVGGARTLAGRAARERSVVTALEDVSFAVPQGESTAIIGRNGAGKSTSLKLATRITYPTSGRIRIRGRVGALLEVGTGMHQELTGRENVDLYGRILGLPRQEVRRRFDEIVEFAGVDGAIDQPVKQYSSGMQLRLGFSVAAHLDPDVLLVDEAIAVGDAAFKYRCVERMSKLVREGRTLIFVTHDMGAIETLCTRAILLDGGRLAHDGPARDVVAAYLQAVDAERLAEETGTPASDDLVEVVRTTLHDATGREVEEIRSGEPLTVRVHYRARRPLPWPAVNIGISDGRLGCFTLASMSRDGGSPAELAGEGTFDCTFDALPILPRVYEVWCGIRGELGYGNLLEWQRLRLFRVVDDMARKGSAAMSMEKTAAPVLLPYRWSFGGREHADG